eukprot:TRINITY_DN23883_c0_g1_i1.p1 TRINITY_DN23883_c0_g1~~TRINITY_DN23883_c0_g1_i1.p1  ORF type:complete len:931 (+),score=113.00 TRINITY_DN23883_c0_g1_i1:82-2874(+)
MQSGILGQAVGGSGSNPTSPQSALQQNVHCKTTAEIGANSTSAQNVNSPAIMPGGLSKAGPTPSPIFSGYPQASAQAGGNTNKFSSLNPQATSAVVPCGGPSQATKSTWAYNVAGLCEERQERNLLSNLSQGAMALNSMNYKKKKPEQPPLLPSGGRYDELLLRPGGSRDLILKLVSIFSGEPPVQCGICADKVGLSCAVKDYAHSVFSPSAVMEIVRLAQGFYKDAPNIMTLPVRAKGRMLLVGDTHGQLEDVLWMFFKYGAPSAENQYVFIGDIADRGGHAVEEFLLLLALKRDAPESVHILRGNHEESNVCQKYGFSAEVLTKFGQQAGGYLLHVFINQLFPVLPLGAIVRGSTSSFFAIHGGVPTYDGQLQPLMIAQLEQINRKQPILDKEQPDLWNTILFNAMWSDPCDVPPIAGGVHQRGRSFSPQDTASFLAANRCSAVIRAHQLPRARRGFDVHHGGAVLTVFSASNYMGSALNRGSVVVCAQESFPLLQAGKTILEFYAPSWSVLAHMYEQFGSLPRSQRAELAEHFESTGTIQSSSSAQSAASPQDKPTAAPAPSSMHPTASSASSPVVPEPKPPHTFGTQPSPDFVGTSSGAHSEVLASVRQIEHSIREDIVKAKDHLFRIFLSKDATQTYRVPLTVWIEIMHAHVAPDIEAEVWQHLANLWHLSGTVSYLKFLQRFEIRALRKKTQTWGALVALSTSLNDTSSYATLKALDPNQDNVVTLDEFIKALHGIGATVPPQQAAALYMTLCQSQPKPHVMHIVECLALVGVMDKPQSENARRVGIEIRTLPTYYRTSAYFFYVTDADRNGFLSNSELRTALRSLPGVGSSITEPDIDALVEEIDGMGVKNDRISLVEFLQAVGDRGLATKLQASLLEEVLKTIYLQRDALRRIFAEMDPWFSGLVEHQDFKSAVQCANATCG